MRHDSPRSPPHCACSAQSQRDVARAAEYVAMPGGTFEQRAAGRRGSPPTRRSRRSACATTPVTNAEFLAFVTAHPRMAARSRRARLRRGALSRRTGSRPTRSAPTALPDQPVTQVSWFAAAAYCESEIARLPTWYEWEYAAAADDDARDARADPAWRERILAWYARPSTAALAPVGGAGRISTACATCTASSGNGSTTSTRCSSRSDSRDQGDPDRLKFCGAGALDAAAIATTMRC